MIRRIEWRTVFWTRRGRTIAIPASAAASALSPERVRELEQPTYLRRNLTIAGLAPVRRAA